MGSDWKILPITARSLEITHLNTVNRAFLNVSVFGHLEFACKCLSFWPPGVCLQMSQFLATWSLLALEGSPKPRHGIFKDMIFKT